MIELVQAAIDDSKEDVLTEMFRHRAKVFHEILEWDVVVEEGCETDWLDQQNPLYVLSICSTTKRLMGSVRLLPTTGPTILSESSDMLLQHDERIISPLAYETSRFVVDPDVVRYIPSSSIHQVAIELLCGVVEVGLYAGIKHVVSVYDQRMSKVFRDAGCDVDIIGGPRLCGKAPVVVGLFDVSLARWRAIASTGHVDSSVLAKPQQHLSGLPNAWAESTTFH
jgi:acyl homoserine lactone synthase